MDKVGQQKSKNSGQPNNITRLPNYATQLEKLKKIWVQGYNKGEAGLMDLSMISDFAKLECLDCSYSQVKDLSPISDLVSLRQLSCSSTSVADLSPI